MASQKVIEYVVPIFVSGTDEKKVKEAAVSLADFLHNQEEIMQDIEADVFVDIAPIEKYNILHLIADQIELKVIQAKRAIRRAVLSYIMSLTGIIL